MAASLHLGEFVPPIAMLAVYAVAYGLRARTLARRGRPVTRWRHASFAAGLLIVVCVQVPPIDDLADESLIAHMIQHLLIGDIASFLIVIALTGPLMAPLLRLRFTRWLRPASHPIAALALWALVTYIWRLPILYQAALRHDLLHALEHASYLWFGILLWIGLLGPLPKPTWFGNWARLGYVVVVRFAGAVLANVFIWSQTLFYPYYDQGAAAHALAQQNVAGAVMMVEQMLLTVGLLGWLFFRLAAQDEDRQSLLDLADRRGTPLSPERAARAAAAGRTAELRHRLLEPERTGEPPTPEA